MFVTLKRILKIAGSYRRLIILQVLSALISTAAALYLPVLFGNAVDLVAGPSQVDMGKIVEILLFAVMVAVIYGVSAYLMTVSSNRLSFSVVRDLRMEAMDSILSASVSFIDRSKTGELTSRVITDTDSVGEGLILGFSQGLSGVLSIAVTLFFMFRLDYRIALTVVLLTPLSLVMAALLSGFSKKHFKRQSVVRGDQTALIDEVVGNQKIVAAFGMQSEYVKRFESINSGLKKASRSAIFFSSLTNPCTRFVNAAVYAAVAFFGARGVIDGSFTVGELTIFLSYASQYTRPFNEISAVVTELTNAIVCAGRVFEIIDEPPFEEYSVADRRHTASGGDVSFSKVDFSYTPEKPLIENFNLDIADGTRVAIVGPTGCGKTTLINLIMRFYDVTGGAIRISGRDVRDIPLANLRGSMGMVLQDTWIKNGTVRENIAIGRPDAAIEEIMSASERVHASDFIERLPSGYDTILGEGGVILSAGEAQLVCIARVMLSLPDILILDEATSSIDTRTEKYIQDSFASLMEGHTSFVVAHRLSTIKNSDIIIVMRDGHIVESGSHDALLARNGFYAELYNASHTA